MSVTLFKEGDVLRYSDGPTALFVVSQVMPNHGGQPRYYGFQYYGSTMGRPHSLCQATGDVDMKKWAGRDADSLVRITDRERPLPPGYAFVRTKLGEFAVGREDGPKLACVRISGDGKVSATDAPMKVVKAAMDRWQELPPELQGCVEEQA